MRYISHMQVRTIRAMKILHIRHIHGCHVKTTRNWTRSSFVFSSKIPIWSRVHFSCCFQYGYGMAEMFEFEDHSTLTTQRWTDITKFQCDCPIKSHWEFSPLVSFLGNGGQSHDISFLWFFLIKHLPRDSVSALKSVFASDFESADISEFETDSTVQMTSLSKTFS